MGLRRWLQKKGLRANNCYHTHSNIAYVNWRSLPFGKLDPEKEWFTLFLEKVNPKRKLVFYSLFGERAYIERKLKNKNDSINIFYTQENVAKETIIPRHYEQYHDYLIDMMDLSMGFDYLDAEKYLRFPYWIQTLIPPQATFEDITDIINEINSFESSVIDNKRYDCSVIASHDHSGNRAKAFGLLSSFMNINSDGAWNKNSSLLSEKYNNDKVEYLKFCKFNLAFENSNSKGYVTEKIFDAFMGKTIPIYWGGAGEVESDIIEPGSFISYQEDDLDKLLLEVEDLYTHPSRYRDFLAQKKIKAGAPEIIYEKITKFENRISDLLS